MTDMLNIVFDSEFTKLVIWLIFAALGFGIKKLANRILDTKEKKELAYDVVTFVEQKYTDLHGEDKFNKAIEAFTEILCERGIKTTTKEMETLIEAAVGALNEAFNKG